MDDFTYENLTAKFRKDNKLLPSKNERVENCFQFVTEKISCSSSGAIETVKKRIVSLELTFMKKLRESKFAVDRFREDNVQ